MHASDFFWGIRGSAEGRAASTFCFCVLVSGPAVNGVILHYVNMRFWDEGLIVWKKAIFSLNFFVVTTLLEIVQVHITQALRNTC